MRCYLDTAPVIYLVEQVAQLGGLVHRRLSTPGIDCVVSDLTRLECRVKPLRDGDAALLADYDAFFARAVVETVPLSEAVIGLATTIRAEHGFKTPDAIHLAAAVVGKCSMFLTNDHHLDRYGGIAIEVISAQSH